MARSENGQAIPSLGVACPGLWITFDQAGFAFFCFQYIYFLEETEELARGLDMAHGRENGGVNHPRSEMSKDLMSTSVVNAGIWSRRR